MINIAICDDDKNSNNRLEALLKRYVAENFIEVLIYSYTTGTELLQSNIEKYDILFLDVDMGEENGIAVAKSIREINKDLILIFVSGLIQYAPAGYKVKAFAYLLKNDLDKMFAATMQESLAEISFNDEIYKVKTDKSEVLIPLKNILYIESFKKTIKIHTLDWDIPFYESQTPIGKVAKELGIKGFLQIHKSYIVNMQYVNKMKNYKALLSNGQEMSVSTRNWQLVVGTYIEWKGNRL
ncbi:MAG: LytTR family DNA-binding domain-containing protein [Oscillospiraceae bacterium]